MRLWALGRRNWLFAWSLESEQRAANIMSLIKSACLNGLNLYAYLTDALRWLPSYTDSQIDAPLSHLWRTGQFRNGWRHTFNCIAIQDIRS